MAVDKQAHLNDYPPPLPLPFVQATPHTAVRMSVTRARGKGRHRGSSRGPGALRMEGANVGGGASGASSAGLRVIRPSLRGWVGGRLIRTHAGGNHA